MAIGVSYFGGKEDYWGTRWGVQKIGFDLAPTTADRIDNLLDVFDFSGYHSDMPNVGPYTDIAGAIDQAVEELLNGDHCITADRDVVDVSTDGRQTVPGKVWMKVKKYKHGKTYYDWELVSLAEADHEQIVEDAAAAAAIAQGITLNALGVGDHLGEFDWYGGADGALIPMPASVLAGLPALLWVMHRRRSTRIAA